MLFVGRCSFDILLHGLLLNLRFSRTAFAHKHCCTATKFGALITPGTKTRHTVNFPLLPGICVHLRAAIIWVVILLVCEALGPGKRSQGVHPTNGPFERPWPFEVYSCAVAEGTECTYEDIKQHTSQRLPFGLDAEDWDFPAIGVRPDDEESDSD